MSAAAAGLILPVPGFCCTRLRCTAQSPAFRVDFPPHKSVHWDSRNFTMNGAVAARINAHDEDQGGLAALEQEPLINDSIVVAASRLEATLNNTVAFCSQFSSVIHPEENTEPETACSHLKIGSWNAVITCTVNLLYRHIYYHLDDSKFWTEWTHSSTRWAYLCTWLLL
ncbi:unnamed protein product [Cuscuta epithymum]|uniref:Uncharacterized protein n=1 Tax=Cuscuta epithymum TaxID=186058 RepID=A0AAV0FA77_9ASTE|nr:unnamed protein product [Cuscuta epithymum]